MKIRLHGIASPLDLTIFFKFSADFPVVLELLIMSVFFLTLPDSITVSA